MKKCEKRFSVQSWIDSEFKSGKASKYIAPFTTLRRGTPVLITVRKSGREKPENRDNAIAMLQLRAKAAGLRVVGVFSISESGFEPSWIGGAALRAQRLGAKVLLGESTDRFVRNWYYRSDLRPDLQATEYQLSNLPRHAKGLRLVTLLDPDATPREIRSYQRKRGQWAKGRRGGRPIAKTPGFKNRTREKLRPKALRLHSLSWSVREISEQLNVPKSTIYDWLRREQ